jgi:competence protein ComGC
MKLTLRKQGFTLVEVMVTMVLSFLVFTTLFLVYHWSAELVTLCGKKNRTQVAAINSSVRIMDCIRNSSQISNIDTNGGSWVELTYSNGVTAVLACTNNPQVTNSEGLGLFRAGQDPIWFVKSGVTQIMGQGHDSVVFSVTTNTPVTNAAILYVRYRVSEPSGDGGRDVQDQNYAMHVRFATCLRNKVN